jgi:hypothetical protein
VVYGGYQIRVERLRGARLTDEGSE